MSASTSNDAEEFTPAFQEPTHTKSCLTVLMCGNANLETEGLAEILHVTDRLGRRKLNGLNDENLTSRINTDVLWMTPKKYWTVSKSSACMQDAFLNIADAYIARDKDVVSRSKRLRLD